MNHLIMGQYQNIIFTVCISHGKCHHGNVHFSGTYGSSFMYSVKSCIHPMFHFRLNPSPSSSGAPVTFGHAVDSSAIIIAPLISSQNHRVQMLEETRPPPDSHCRRTGWQPTLRHSFHSPDTASTPPHPHEARPHG